MRGRDKNPGGHLEGFGHHQFRFVWDLVVLGLLEAVCNARDACSLKVAKERLENNHRMCYNTKHVRKAR